VSAAKKKTATTRTADALKAGDEIEKTFKGKALRLKVTDEGFVLGRKTFPSLTAAARHVTGYKAVSGPRFWLGAEKGGNA
jgi:hypothetical protein